MAVATARETVTLIQVNAAGNNNKFYELTKLASGDTSARWGRIGGGKAQSRIYPGHGSFHDKLEEKLRRGYEIFNGGDKVVPASRGLVRDHVIAGLLPGAAASPATKDMVTGLIRSNRHAIDTATGGRIRVSDSGAVTTALGPVSLSQIAAARDQLAVLRSGYNQWAVERYLTLIPQQIRNIRDTDWVTPRWCRNQVDLLDALEAAVTMSGAVLTDDSGADAVAIPFRHTLGEIDSSDDEFKRLAAKFDRSRNAMHAADRLRLRRVWTLADTDASAWDARKKELKHTRELWHGTSAGNVLSILRTGLICPAFSASSYNTTGRMFGDGIYFSDQSTKALNYAIGGAPGQSGGGSRSGAPMMFLADVVMGRECRSEATTSGSEVVRRSRTGTDAKGRKYNSLYIRGGHCGVRNNEMVVWGTEQIKLTHLCEFH